MKRIFLHLVISIFLLPVAVLADGTLMSWGMKDIKGMTQERFEAAKKWPIADILQNNIGAETWAEAYLVVVAAAQHKDSIVQQLIAQLSNGQVRQLGLTSRLIIWERILSGEILFEGKGFQTYDDLFSVAGRANWVLRNITKQNFGYVSVGTTASDLIQLQAKWQQWLDGKPVATYINPYDSKEKGLDETHSLVAFEALIYSLQPSAQKAALTSNCLKQIYQLDEMPKDKTSSANFCNPDNYTLFYLNALLGEKDNTATRDYAWWKNWWADNHSKLKWNAEKAIFEMGN